MQFGLVMAHVAVVRKQAHVCEMHVYKHQHVPPMGSCRANKTWSIDYLVENRAAASHRPVSQLPP